MKDKNYQRYNKKFKNLQSSIFTIKIELVMRNHSTNKTLGLDDFIDKIHLTFKKQIIPILHQENRERKDTFQLIV